MSVELITERTATPSQAAKKVQFTSGSKVVINAPASKVFDAITDFSRYSEWNTWTPSFAAEGSDAEIKPGLKGILKTRMDPKSEKELNVPIQFLKLNRSEEECVVAWQGQMVPRWTLLPERVQIVTPVKGNEANACEVKQWESMSGIGAWALKTLTSMTGQLNERNVNYLKELKAFVEAA